jgi:hypothetical protein
VCATPASAGLLGELFDSLTRRDDPVRTEQQPQPQAAAAGRELKGLFEVAAGTCGSGGITGGSYFRMVQPGGTVQNGPFVENGDADCGDNSATPLRPGTDKGLSTSGYQTHPDPAFDTTGNGQSDKIIQPQSFFGTDFAAATNPIDPQSSTEVPIPSILEEGGNLSGDVRAFGAAWNNQHFNQGSPKPNGERPGNTTGPTGTFNASNNTFALEWASTIVGGPFNNFTGVWHLEGTFRSGVTVGTAGNTGGGGGGGTGGAAVGGTGTGSGSGSGSVGALRTGPTPRTGPSSSVPAGLAVIALAVATRRLVVPAPGRRLR